MTIHIGRLVLGYPIFVAFALVRTVRFVREMHMLAAAEAAGERSD